MRIESIREVKANLNKIVGALPEEGSTYDRALRRAEREGWASLDDV